MARISSSLLFLAYFSYNLRSSNFWIYNALRTYFQRAQTLHRKLLVSGFLVATLRLHLAPEVLRPVMELVLARVEEQHALDFLLGWWDFLQLGLLLPDLALLDAASEILERREVLVEHLCVSGGALRTPWQWLSF